MYQIIKSTPNVSRRVMHNEIETYALAAYMVRDIVKHYKEEAPHGEKGDNCYRKSGAVCYAGGDRHEFLIERV